jgi:hypothetical protein
MCREAESSRCCDGSHLGSLRRAGIRFAHTSAKELHMKRIAIAIATLLAAGTAIAGDTARFGNQVISTGDSEGRLRQVAGKPDRETPIESRHGGLEGYRLEYFQRGKSVQVEVINGRVASITQIES